MKNLLTKGLIFGIMAGAFCVNYGEVGADSFGQKAKNLRDNMLNRSNFADRNQNKLVNSSQELIKLNADLSNAEQELGRSGLSASKRKSLEKKIADLTGKIAKQEAEVERRAGKLKNMAGKNINIEDLKQIMSQIESTVKLTSKNVKSFVAKRDEGTLDAAKNAAFNLYMYVRKMMYMYGYEISGLNSAERDIDDSIQRIRSMDSKNAKKTLGQKFNDFKQGARDWAERKFGKNRGRRVDNDMNGYDLSSSGNWVKYRDSNTQEIRVGTPVEDY